MLIVTTQDGAAFKGRTAAQVVSKMRRDNWNAPARKLEYMEEVAERIYQTTGQTIRTDACHFLADLEDVGVIVVAVQIQVPMRTLALVKDSAREDADLDAPSRTRLREFVEVADGWLLQAGRAE